MNDSKHNTEAKSSREEIAWALVLAIVFAFVYPLAEKLDTKIDAMSSSAPIWLLRAGWMVSNLALLLLGFGVLRLTHPRLPSATLLIVRISNGGKTFVRHSRLAIRWARFVMTGKQPAIIRIRTAIAQAYTRQEVLDLSGESDLLNRTWTPEECASWVRAGHGPVERRPLIITSFVRYGRLIAAMLKGAQYAVTRNHREPTIICITGITMPLTKWLNFDRKSNSHPAWEDYLEFLRTRILNSSKFVLARIVLVTNDPQDEATLQTRDELRSDMQHLVWEEMRVQASAYVDGTYVIRPVTPEALATTFQSVWPAGALEPDNVKGDRSAYVIIDVANTTIADKARDWQGIGRFRRLGEVFIERFHSPLSDPRCHHAYYAAIDVKDQRANPDTAIPPNPSDFFYVGLVNPSGETPNSLDRLAELTCEGLFCLTAKPDSDLHMVNVALVDPSRSPQSFNAMNEYVRRLLVSCRPLSELL